MITRFIKKTLHQLKPRRKQRSQADQPPHQAQIIHSERHPIALSAISKNALHVLNRLHQAGYQSYLVGGGVRDLLLGLKPKDFDIATDAHPETVRKLFRNSRLIGRRFRLAHVFFGREIVEVATFRKEHPEQAHPEARQSATGMLVRDNIYGTMEEDAWRRDFSVNALYYNIADLSVVDYTNGVADLEQRLIRVLGDPTARFKEDPVRMLRAIRFAAKLNFTLEARTAQTIHVLKELIQHVSSARLFDEVLKLFYCGHASNAMHLLRQYGLFGILFPETEQQLTTDNPQREQTLFLILESCNNTDVRLQQGKSLNPAFLFAVLLWPPLWVKIQHLQNEGHRPLTALQLAGNQVLRQQLTHTAIPRRFTTITQEIWQLQHSLQHYSKRKVATIYAHPRFRAGYDFMLLRYQAGETELQSAITWWEAYQQATADERLELVKQLKTPTSHPPQRRRRKKAEGSS